MAPKTPSEMFKVIDEIGRGQFGKVFKVRGSRNGNVENQLFAAKIQPLRDNDDFLLCQKEINLLRNACERFFPKLFLAFELTDGQDQKHSVMIMELGRGTLQDLDRLENKSIELSQTVKLWILRKVADALEYMHFRCNILHGDIKPSNILFDHNYEPVLCDLGLAKVMKDVQDSKQGLGVELPDVYEGTRIYMAYECLLRTFYGVRSDMWAWGCTAYFLFTNKHLMSDLSITGILFASRPNETTPSMYIMDKLRAMKNPAVSGFLKSFFCKIDDRPDKINSAEGYQQLFREVTKLSFADYFTQVSGLFNGISSLQNVTSADGQEDNTEMQNVLSGRIKEFSYSSLGYDESEHGVKTADRKKGRFVKKENLLTMKRCNHLKRRKTVRVVSEMRRRSHSRFSDRKLKQILRNSH